MSAGGKGGVADEEIPPYLGALCVGGIFAGGGL